MKIKNPLVKFKEFVSIKRKQTVNFAKKKTARENAIEISLLIYNKFHNWITAEELQDKFKRQFATIKYTEEVLQTLVYFKVAVVKQMPNERPRYKVCHPRDSRGYIIDETIKQYELLIESLKEERKLLK